MKGEASNSSCLLQICSAFCVRYLRVWSDMDFVGKKQRGKYIARHVETVHGEL